MFSFSLSWTLLFVMDLFVLFVTDPSFFRAVLYAPCQNRPVTHFRVMTHQLSTTALIHNEGLSNMERQEGSL